MPKSITLSASYSDGVTVIPNTFFDEYLPRANGEFLKIYLYLLRWLSHPEHTLSLSGIADIFFMTENDVTRALKYWEAEGLLRLSFDRDGSVAGICLNPVASISGNSVREYASADAYSMQNQPTQSYAARTSQSVQSTAAASSGTSVGRTQASDVNTEAAASAGIQPRSTQELHRFSESDDGAQLIFIIQQYLGRPLSASDLNTIYYFYDDLGFSRDLIEYLFEYCVSNGHTHMRYIEKVALSWADLHITTADEARTQSESHQKACFAVLKAFGLGGRMPAAGEAEYINKWTRTYGFSLDLILEACRRTMMAVHTPSFEYTDKILSNWQSLGAYTMTEVLAADKARSAQKAAAPVNRPASKQTRPSSNKFHNFNQRSYDYAALEKKLAARVQNNSNSNNQ